MILAKYTRKVQRLGGSVYVPIPLDIWRAWEIQKMRPYIDVELNEKGDVIIRKPSQEINSEIGVK